jgi:hypothetical protein
MLKLSDGGLYLELDGQKTDGPLGVYNEGPPHDHNASLGGNVYMEDVHPSFMEDFQEREVYVGVLEVCPSHLGKDCSCKSGFIIMPRLFNGSVLVDMYGVIKNSPYAHEDDFYFYD